MKSLFFFVLAFAFLSPAAPAARAEWRRLPSASLEYWIYVPAKRSAPPALMVNLHGCTQRAQDFKERGNWEAAADKYNMVVAIPDVPNGGVVLGCWDYYGANHTVDNRHNGAVLSFVEGLLADKELNLDRKNVYVAGLSSGAGEAMVLACLRPDLFRGVGLVGSPALGTGQQDIARPNIGAGEVAENCRRLANGKSFAGQRTSIVHGDQDFVVNPLHSALIAEAFAGIYGAAPAERIDVNRLEGTGAGGSGELYRDAAGTARLSLISATGLGHAWPAGSGQGFAMKYINPQSLNYPAYLGAFFSERRAGGGL